MSHQHRGWGVALHPDITSDYTFTALSRSARWAYLDSMFAAARSDGPGSLYPFTELVYEVGKEADQIAGELVDREFWAIVALGYVAQPFDLCWLRPLRRAFIPATTRAFVFTRDGHRCVQCGSTETLQLDHIHPWSRGGTDRPSNLQTLCRPCNTRKGAST